MDAILEIIKYILLYLILDVVKDIIKKRQAVDIPQSHLLIFLFILYTNYFILYNYFYFFKDFGYNSKSFLLIKNPNTRYWGSFIQFGADDGNRTRIATLARLCSTTELHLHF